MSRGPDCFATVIRPSLKPVINFKRVPPQRSLTSRWRKPENAAQPAFQEITHSHEPGGETATSMVKAFRRLDQLREAHRLKSWLITIAINESRMRMRMRERYKVVSREIIIGELSRYIEGELKPHLRARIEVGLKFCSQCKFLLDPARNLLYLVADEKVFFPPFHCSLEGQRAFCGVRS